MPKTEFNHCLTFQICLFEARRILNLLAHIYIYYIIYLYLRTAKLHSYCYVLSSARKVGQFQQDGWDIPLPPSLISGIPMMKVWIIGLSSHTQREDN